MLYNMYYYKISMLPPSPKVIKSYPNQKVACLGMSKFVSGWPICAPMSEYYTVEYNYHIWMA